MKTESSAPSFSRRLITLILRFWWFFSLFTVIATVAAIASSKNIIVQNSPRVLYDYPGNDAVPLYDAAVAEFGDPAPHMAIVMEAEDIFEPAMLAYIKTLTSRLETFPFISRVRSLSNTTFVSGSGDGVAVGPLLDKLPQTKEEAAEVRKRALDSRVFYRRLISADGKMTAIALDWQKGRFAEDLESFEFEAKVDELMKELPPPPKTRVIKTGLTPIQHELNTVQMRDMTTTPPIALLVIMLVLLVAFRKLHGIIMPVLAVVLSLIWTIGLWPIFLGPMDVIASTLPVVLLTYGVVDPIFVLSRFLEQLPKAENRRDAIVRAYEGLLMPCFLTSATTAGGFFSFALLANKSVVNFGLGAGIGVCMAFFTTLFIHPVLLLMLPLPKSAHTHGRAAQLLESWIDRSWELVAKRKVTVILGGVLIAAVCLGLSARLQISSLYTNGLPRGRVLEEVRYVESKMSGLDGTMLLIEGKPDAMKQPEVLAAIKRVSDEIEKDKLVTNVASVVDLLGEMNQAFMGGDPKERKPPPTRALSAQYLSLLDPTDRDKFVNTDYSRTHLDVFSTDDGSLPWYEVRAKVERLSAEAFKGLDVTTKISGLVAVYYPALDKLVLDMLLGFIYAWLIILAFELVFFRSLRIVLISILPNLIPSVVCFGILGAFDVTLSLGASLVLSISIGGLFTTTIQLAARVQQLIALGHTDPDAIIKDAMRTVVPPSLVTAIVLSLGFSVFMFCSFRDLRLVGLLSATVLTVGFASDLLITPVLLRMFMKWPEPTKSSQPALVTEKR